MRFVKIANYATKIGAAIALAFLLDACGGGSSSDQQPTSPVNTTYNAVAWSGKQFVVVGGGGLSVTSTDGVTWKYQSSAIPAAEVLSATTLNSITWNGSEFIAGGTTGGSTICQPSQSVCPALAMPQSITILNSADGLTWTSALTSSLTIYGQVGDVIGSGSSFVAVGNFMPTQLSTTPLTQTFFLDSQNGTTWTPEAGGSVAMGSVAWSGSQYVAVGVGGAVSTSPDGVTWSNQNSPLAYTYHDANLNSVIWDGSQFIAVGTNGGSVNCPAGDTCPSTAIADFSVILTSPDGINWSSHAQAAVTGSSLGSGLDTIIWNGKQYVAAGVNGVILTSPDGLAWTVQNSGVSGTITGITWSGTQFAAVGPNLILTSPDGVTWTRRTAS